MKKDLQFPVYVPEGSVDQGKTYYRWATVTGTDPVRIRLDGDTVSLPVTPGALVALSYLVEGMRVWVQGYGRRLLILGVAGGAPPPPEGWHLVDGSGEPAFQNSWENYSTPAFHATSFRREGYRVYLRGLIKSGTSGSGATGTVFTLPVGWRPNSQEIFNQWSNTGAARVDVATDGIVKVVSYATGGTNGFVSLSGISFDWDGTLA